MGIDRKKEEQDEADRREAERNKPMLLLLQQMQSQIQLIQQQQAAVVPTVPGASSSSPSTGTAVVSPAIGATTTRLPQRQIRHFKGDILECSSFWETFNAAIHTSNIPTVQRFDYLKEYLNGEVRLIVENLELTTNNLTDIDCVLKFIRAQTEAAERFNRLKTADKKAAQQKCPENGDNNSIAVGDRSQISSGSITKT